MFAPAFVAAVRGELGAPRCPELAWEQGALHERYRPHFRAWEEIYGEDGYIRRRRRLATSPSTPEWLRQLGLRRASEWTRPWEEAGHVAVGENGVLIGDPWSDDLPGDDDNAYQINAAAVDAVMLAADDEDHPEPAEAQRLNRR